VQRVEVEDVQLVAEREHHVVRHVDDVRDRAHARRAQSSFQPDGRLLELDVAKEAPDVAGAADRILDSDVDRLGGAARRVGLLERRELAVEERSHVARDAVDREQVDAVARRLEVEHLLDERQHVGERCARLERVVEHHDPVVVGAEVDLVLGEDHPLRDLAAELAAVEGQPVRERRTGQCDGDLRAGAEVPRAADDLVRAVLADVHLRQLQTVRVRMLAGLEHVPDAEAGDVGGAAALDPVHLGGRDRQPVCDLLGRCVDAHVLAQPAERDLHRNCLRKRKSLSQNGRMSPIP